MSFRAPKRVGETIAYKTFNEGDVIQATPHNQGTLPMNNLQVMKTKDGYIIPRSNLNVLGEVQTRNNYIPEAEVVQSNFVDDKPLKRVFKRSTGSEQAVQPSGLIKTQVQRTKYGVQGALIGGGAMLLYAMMKGKSKMVYAAIGTVLGYYGGTMFNEYNKKENVDKN